MTDADATQTPNIADNLDAIWAAGLNDLECRDDPEAVMCDITDATPTPGRPKLPDGEARDELLNVRLRPEEKAKVESDAEAAGLKMSDYLRAVLLDPGERKPPPKPFHMTWVSGEDIKLECWCPLPAHTWRQLYGLVVDMMRPPEVEKPQGKPT